MGARTSTDAEAGTRGDDTIGRKAYSPHSLVAVLGPSITQPSIATGKTGRLFRKLDKLRASKQRQHRLKRRMERRRSKDLRRLKRTFRKRGHKFVEPQEKLRRQLRHRYFSKEATQQRLFVYHGPLVTGLPQQTTAAAHSSMWAWMSVCVDHAGPRSLLLMMSSHDELVLSWLETPHGHTKLCWTSSNCACLVAPRTRPPLRALASLGSCIHSLPMAHVPLFPFVLLFPRISPLGTHRLPNGLPDKAKTHERDVCLARQRGWLLLVALGARHHRWLVKSAQAKSERLLTKWSKAAKRIAVAWRKYKSWRHVVVAR